MQLGSTMSLPAKGCKQYKEIVNFLERLAAEKMRLDGALVAGIAIALREPNETSSYRSQFAIATMPVDQLQVQLTRRIVTTQMAAQNFLHVCIFNNFCVSCNITVGTFHAAPRLAQKAAARRTARVGGGRAVRPA